MHAPLRSQQAAGEPIGERHIVLETIAEVSVLAIGDFDTGAGLDVLFRPAIALARGAHPGARRAALVATHTGSRASDAIRICVPLHGTAPDQGRTHYGCDLLRFAAVVSRGRPIPGAASLASR